MSRRYYLKSFLYLLLLLLSPAVCAHVSGTEALDIRDEILHVILEPSHSTILWFVVFMLALVLRHKVLRMTEWFLKLRFKQ